MKPIMRILSCRRRTYVQKKASLTESIDDSLMARVFEKAQMAGFIFVTNVQNVEICIDVIRNVFSVLLFLIKKGIFNVFNFLVAHLKNSTKRAKLLHKKR